MNKYIYVIKLDGTGYVKIGIAKDISQGGADSEWWPWDPDSKKKMTTVIR